MKYVLIGMMMIALAGCGRAVVDAPKYQADESLRYGDWAIAKADLCTVVGNSVDVRATTDGQFSDGFIQIRLSFALPLAGVPKASLSGYDVVLPLEGATRNYAINMLYDATTAAHLLQPDTFLTIVYQPLTSPVPLEVNFATRGLVHALAGLRAHCA